MKKRNVLKYLPQVKTLGKEAKTKMKQGLRLMKEADESREIADTLKGVTLFKGFPVKTVTYSGGVEILSGCDDVKRSAYVQKTGTNRCRVTTYRNDGSDIDGTPVEGEHKYTKAIRLAKEFVATGKKVRID